MHSDLAWRKRAQERHLRDAAAAEGRLVDIGVELRIVVFDCLGQSLITGKPKLRVVKRRRFGGILDTKSNPARIVAPSTSPRVWYCSEDQFPVIVHDDADPLGQLVYGSEGAGKTTALAMWHYFRWLEHLGEKREGGQTAPTKPRLKMIRDEFFNVLRGWFKHRVAEDVIVLCDGTRIQLRSTKQQSKDAGSPIQGYNWSWCGRDEGQDQIARHEDIESRGRAAKNGRYKQLITATAKDSTAWRTFRDVLLKAKTPDGVHLWLKRTLLGPRSPFVFASFWEAKKAAMTEREYRRRVLAEDVGPELQLYNTWDRAKNVRTIPHDAVDITHLELASMGANIVVLTGFDPGRLCDVSILLKAFRIPGVPRPVWFVLGEITTEQSTTEHHVQALLREVGARWKCNLRDRYGAILGPRIAVRADPYGDTGNDETRPDITVYKVFRNAGILIKPAAYVANANAIKVMKVPKEARIDMVCTLLCAANGERRLYVAANDNGSPCAPKLVEALETMERDAAGRAEHEKKNKHDLSHWPAALGYGLWAIEKPRIEAMRKAA